MRLGKMALFCGINDQADFELKSKHLDWADIIIILTNDITAIYSRHIDLYTNNSDRYRLNFYIDDRPEQFKTKFKELKQILIQKQLW